ncbi:MAG: proteasome assembly chaperone family protein [Candidatus Micrarchaeaceae archaeon]
MDKTIIKMKKGIRLHNPILIAGLPGIGNVGKIVAEQMRKEFKAVRFATLYSPHFPHQVIMRKDGSIRLVSNIFYYIKAKNGGSDLVILTGDVQAVTPEGQYEVNSKIIKFFKEVLHGTFVYTIGGYMETDSIVSQPKVFANATTKDIVEKFSSAGVIFGKTRGAIWGTAGLLIAFAKMEKLDGICLMGETGLLDVDPAAAKAVLLVLSKKLGLKIDTTKMDKMIEATAKMLKELEQSAMYQESKESQKPTYIR